MESSFVVIHSTRIIKAIWFCKKKMTRYWSFPLDSFEFLDNYYTSWHTVMQMYIVMNILTNQYYESFNKLKTYDSCLRWNCIWIIQNILQHPTVTVNNNSSELAAYTGWVILKSFKVGKEIVETISCSNYLQILN